MSLSPKTFIARVINCLIYNENYERERVYKFKAAFGGRRRKTLPNDPRWHFYEELSRISIVDWCQSIIQMWSFYDTSCKH